MNKSDGLIKTYDDIEKIARALAGSGYFQDTKQISQAIVKIVAGVELGIGPFAAMVGVNIISGRPALSANTMAAMIKRSGKYDYKVEEITENACSIKFFEKTDGAQNLLGASVFTRDDAKNAGTKNLDRFPRNMLFARAMSNGVKWFCPDVLNGSPAYTPEELDAGEEVFEDYDLSDVPSGDVESVFDFDASKNDIVAEKDIEQTVDEEIAGGNVAHSEPEDALTLEQAYQIKNSEGTLYGELSAEKLSMMTRGIDKALKSGKHTPEEVLEYQKKLQAIKLLLAAKNDGSIK